MDRLGGGGPEGTQISPAEGVSYPLACNEVRIVNEYGGIMECVSFGEACARGIVADGLDCTTQPSARLAASGLSSASGVSAASPAPQSLDSVGCMFCGSVLLGLIVIADVLFGTNLIIRRSKVSDPNLKSNRTDVNIRK